MKMIDVLNMMAKGNLKEGTILKFVDSCNEIVSYIYDEEMNAFYDEAQYDLGSEGEICGPFLNKKVELIPPKPKKYLIKLTIKGINNENTYLNRSREKNVIFLSDSFEGQYTQTKFTKQEMQDIQLIREFLEDMQGKFELIEVEECD